MADEVTFIDLACLLKIAPDTTLEKLGSTINSSIFDASNIAGGLKQKGLIDFTAYYPGPNTIAVTDVGKSLIAEANSKTTEPFDELDHEILFQLSGGKRIAPELQNTLNLRPKDLTLRLYKLDKLGFITYELKNGNAEIMLTESGFLKSKAPSASKPPQEATQQAQQPSATETAQIQESSQNHEQLQLNPGKRNKGTAAAIIILLVIIAVVAIHFLYP